ncbi:hypothetical protein [Rubinisphaera sp.]|uniref:hypothetical protein n=1 Tax=Rubinisphaera sp. TaxID=2024857 RepID=UPI000C113B4A|nr:hypothetical protein [Rubinisphaera sp.]MBV10648.1 hypothetical protein [Rubinisphaera sp.]|tara:strand:- start:1327 stop:1863 length:537 start_codon:yes stop_codon:yes gene_type:complete
MRRKPHQFEHRKGISLLEVSISTLLVAFLMITSLKCIGAVVRGRGMTAKYVQAEQLAQEMMTEIMRQPYRDGFLPLFGLEALELVYINGPRSNYDDVDDYNGWSASPPKDRSNSAISNTTGWQRQVSVAWVNKSNPSQISGYETGLKRITVTVKHNGITMAQLVALRSQDFEIDASDR